MQEADRARSVIRKGGRYLLLQEGEGPSKGTWTFAGGSIDEGETPESAALREAKEEAGFDVKIIRKIGAFKTIEAGNWFLTYIFDTEIISGELKFPTDEIIDGRWLTAKEIREGGCILKGDYVLNAIDILEG
jgi:8-oxo-dGTP diphosphatase